MKKTFFNRLACAIFCFAFAFIPSMTVLAENTLETNYTYDFWAVVSKSVPAFEIVRTIDQNTMPDVTVSGIDDVSCGGGRVFLIDTQESRLNVLDENFEFVISIKLIRNEDRKIVIIPETGEQLVLTNPEGVWFHESANEIYIADTGAERIIVLDGDGYFLKRIIERPENMAGVTQFAPSKIVVDKADRIYVVVQSGFEGIVELDKSGAFSRYYGVNKPKVDLIDYFWKRFASDTQREKMAKSFAPSFNNVDIDTNGFVYATTYDAAAQEMVFRLNPKGENVLLQKGYFEVRGDSILMFSSGEPTKFIDVAINDYGVYAVLDQTKGRIFLYDFDGNLLNIFGERSDMKDGFKAPTSIAWFGDMLIAGDKSLKCAYVYDMTEFGRAALYATKSYYNGEWEESARLFEKALSLNANFDIAYIGIGKYYLVNDDYKNAMYYFKLGQDRTFYSKAFNGYRNIWVQENFIWILIVVLLGIGAVIYSEVKYHRKGREGNKQLSS